ncbi:helix-turn-helix domain-containing protein [Streptomyces sp. NPDC006365]|uniref:helix-turn-helix domain-containing protein n=1 Tax=Streptomyces sp. NPDC006365 TaxID=3364744 RepID=UPI003679B056
MEVHGGIAAEEVNESVGRSLAAIRTRYCEPLSLDELALIAGLSKFHFCRIFQREIGVTPVKFLGRVRIQQAMHLLESTTLSVAEIVRRVGYSSVGTFTTRFSRYAGFTPGRYRAEQAGTQSKGVAPPAPSGEGPH